MAGIYRRRFHDLSNTLALLYDHEFKPPDFETVYTPFALTEAVTLGNGTYLIYDQYLGQVLNRLNRLVFEDASPAEVDEYVCKLFALRCLAAGEIDRAAEYAVLHLAMREGNNPEPPERSRQTKEASGIPYRRAEYTVSQETFVLAHELAHSFHRKNADLARLWQDHFMRLADTWAKRKDDHLKTIDQNRYYAEGHVRDYDRAWVRRYGPSAVDEADRREAMEAAIDKLGEEGSTIESQIEMVRRVQENASLLEECTCDVMGAQLTAVSLSLSLGFPFTTSVPASLLGLYHMRLLRYIDLRAEGKADYDTVDESFFKETVTRVGIFRLITEAWFWSLIYDREGGESELSDMHKRLVRENENHSLVLLDQVMGHFDDVATPRLGETRKLVIEPAMRSGRDLREITELLCGLESTGTPIA